MEIDVTDRFGNRPVRLAFTETGQIVAVNGNEKVTLQSFESDKWYNVGLNIDASPFGKYSVTIDGKSVLTKADLAEAVTSVERLSLRTGPYRNSPSRRTPNQEEAPPLPGADDTVAQAIYYIDDVNISVK